MIRNLKALTLAATAVVVFSAISAAGAQADKDAMFVLKKTNGETVEKGTLDSKLKKPAEFERAGRAIECEEGEYVSHIKDGDTAATAEEMTFSECSSTLGMNATISMSGCGFNYKLTADYINNKHTYTGITKLECPEEAEATITVYSGSEHSEEEIVCRYGLPEQEFLAKFDLTNEKANVAEKTPDDWILVHGGLEEVTSTRTMGSALLCGPEHDESGSLLVDWVVKATDANKNGINVTIDTDPEE